MHKKVSETLIIPQSVVTIAQEIVSLFDASSPDALIESDDLIQTDDSYAGRIEGNKFGIRYFPEIDVPSNYAQPKWDFTFTLEELRAIANDTLQMCVIWKCVADCGMKSSEKDFECFNCDL